MIKVKIVPVSIDILDKLPLLYSIQARYQIARNIMEGARARLIKTASEQLHSTRADYIAGIQPLERDGKSVVLALVGTLPNMIENGWDERFLHETLLGNGSSGWKVSAEGYRYRAIPFRHKTPGAGPQGGQPMGSQFGPGGGLSRAAPHAVVEDTRKLGKQIHGAAKKLISNSEAQAGAKGSSRLASGLAPKLRSHHSTDIFAGMIVNKQPVQGAGGKVSHQRTYTTFRMISEKVEDKWFHPGIEARNFLDTLGDFVQKIAPGAIEAYATEVFKP